MTVVTVFGGTGFLGRHVVEQLVGEEAEVRVACRRPERIRRPPEQAPERVTTIVADVRDEESVAKAVEGATAAVNAVSTYVEKGRVTFTAVHELGALHVARRSAKAGLERLVYISGIGADPGARSRYVRARGRGEAIVREAFPNATVLRPSAMFGSGGGILDALLSVARASPVFPLIGGGHTGLQPVHVRDVALAVVQALKRPEASGRTYELGGPRIYTLRELVELVLRHHGLRRLFVKIPFSVAELQAAVFELLPNPPLTVGAVDLLRRDNVVSSSAFRFADLAIEPVGVDDTLRSGVGGRGAEHSVGKWP